MTDPGVAPDERPTFTAAEIDRCHESTDFAHECKVCRDPAQPAGTPAVRLAEETISRLHARLAEVIAERDRLADAVRDIGRAVTCYLGVESDSLPADVRRLVDRCAAAETALMDLSETEAALERVRACLLLGGQSAAFRAQVALAALYAPADAGGGGADG